MEQLEKLGKAESDLGPMLKRAASLRPDVSQLTFVRCEAKTRMARLHYQREGGGPKGPTGASADRGSLRAGAPSCHPARAASA
jgi:hypothetical protein